MAKYIFILLFTTSCSLFTGVNTVTTTIDATKDTTFFLNGKGGGPSIIFDINGYLSDSTLIEIAYHESKDNPNTNLTLTIPLNAGKVHLKDVRRDFYGAHAKISFKHLENKKGKLKISASMF
ncbi:hypothetical protein VB776_17945 [Arcicella sp. DC2W]|uniref:Lipoprotein n=1 Tax=Arcicella gelida TaxID=2984195 RepID=A0ABU5S8L9_9BACT|nr:hypothetical protein [Arcicella sp. DC2W]MEA5404822.1 hypothetical protein [Arcicella sp. DC2W]